MDPKKLFEMAKRFEAQIVDKEDVSRINAKIESCKNESKKLSDIEACLTVLNCEYLSDVFYFKAKQMIGSIRTESGVLQSKIDIFEKEKENALRQYEDYSAGLKIYVAACMKIVKIRREVSCTENDRLKPYRRELRRIRGDVDGVILGFKNKLSDELLVEMNDTLKYVDDLCEELDNRMSK